MPSFTPLFVTEKNKSKWDEMKNNKVSAQRTKSLHLYNRSVNYCLAAFFHKKGVFGPAVDFNCSENKCVVPAFRQSTSSKCNKAL